MMSAWLSCSCEACGRRWTNDCSISSGWYAPKHAMTLIWFYYISSTVRSFICRATPSQLEHINFRISGASEGGARLAHTHFFFFQPGQISSLSLQGRCHNTWSILTLAFLVTVLAACRVPWFLKVLVNGPCHQKHWLCFPSFPFLFLIFSFSVDFLPFSGLFFFSCLFRSSKKGFSLREPERPGVHFIHILLYALFKR